MPASPPPVPATGIPPFNGLRHRAGPLGTVMLLHIACFYLLQNGLSKPATTVAAPREVIATFITPEPAPQPPAPEPPKPQPTPPKPKAPPVVRKTVTPPKPVPPVANAMPSPQAISTPPSEPPPPSPAPAGPTPATPAPAAPPAAPAMPKTITTGIEYLRRPGLDYPAVSRRMGEEGIVTLRVLVNDKGQPERAEIQKSSGYARLDEAGRKAVLAALFKPYSENGRAMAAYVIVPFNFNLQN